MLRRFFYYVVFFLFLSLVFMPGMALAGETAVDTEPNILETGVFDEVLEYIYNYHVDAPELDGLIEGAIDGLIDTLDDPYTSYIPPESVDGFYDALEGNYAGIGVLIEQGEDYPVAVDVFEQSPAQLAGMKNKDKIIKIEGLDVKGLTLTEVSELLRGPEGTKVLVEVNRDNRTDIELSITRATVSAPTVSAEMMGEDTGYISITTFNSHTDMEFRRAITLLKNQGMEKLVLDLRGNSGGILQAATGVASHFIDYGKTIVTTEDRFGSQEVYSSSGTKLAEGIKVVVLVDGATASAAEILASALCDYGLATLVGDKTFGKGVVQYLISLESGGSLKVTVQKYFTPNGVCIHGNGLDPDRRVLTDNLQLIAATQELEGVQAKTVSLQLGSTVADIDGEEVSCGVEPYADGGEVYLPLRFVLEALGHEVKWLDDLKSVEVTKGKERILLSLAEAGVVSKNGVTFFTLEKTGLLNVQHSKSGNNIYVTVR